MHQTAALPPGLCLPNANQNGHFYLDFLRPSLIHYQRTVPFGGTERGNSRPLPGRARLIYHPAVGERSPMTRTRIFPRLLLVFMLALVAFAARQAPAVSAAPPTDLFISEYIEGSSNNKAIEIYNGTGATVNLATGMYDIQLFSNGATTAGLTISLTGSVANGDVYVVAAHRCQRCDPGIRPINIQRRLDLQWQRRTCALRNGATIVDVLWYCSAMIRALNGWGTGLTSPTTKYARAQEHNLRRGNEYRQCL